MRCYNPEKHHRRSIRLRSYDYSHAGAYFVTISTQDRVSLFGDVEKGCMHLNKIGKMVFSEWNQLPNRFSEIDLDALIIMPNHVHGIIVIRDDFVGAGLVPALGAVQGVVGGLENRAITRIAPTVGQVVGAFKSITTVLYSRGVRMDGWPPFRARLWQRNYYEQVICNETVLNQIRQYILDNPENWAIDPENTNSNHLPPQSFDFF